MPCSPGFIFYHIPNVCQRDVEHNTKACLTTPFFVQVPHLSYFGPIKFGQATTFAKRMSQFLFLVALIFKVCPYKEVAWSDAGRRVAFVADKLSIWNLAVCQIPRCTVSSANGRCHKYGEIPVTIFILWPAPQPAISTLFYIFPKSGADCLIGKFVVLRPGSKNTESFKNPVCGGKFKAKLFGCWGYATSIFHVKLGNSHRVNKNHLSNHVSSLPNYPGKMFPLVEIRRQLAL